MQYTDYDKVRREFCRSFCQRVPYSVLQKYADFFYPVFGTSCRLKQ